MNLHLKCLIVFCSYLLFSMNSASQQLFIDSNQKLANSFSWDVKLGDLDNDDDLDAVIANSWDSNQKNDIWLNNGDAYFTKGQQLAGSTSCVTLFDVNTDGHLDIIEHSPQNTEMITLLNDGNAIFSQSGQYQFKGNFIVFDEQVNNDNHFVAITLEIHEELDSTVIRIYSFQKDTVGLLNTIILDDYPGNCLSIGDLNNDGYSDIVLGHGFPEPGPAIILFNNKNYSFTRGAQDLENYINTNIYIADLNMDNSPDLLFCNYHNPNPPYEIYPAKLYFNNGMGHFSAKQLPYNSSYIAPNAAILDLNNDGSPDIFMNHGHQHSGTSHKSEILFNDGMGNFTPVTVNLDNKNCISAAFGDLDRDGDFDAFFACGDLEQIGRPNKVWLNTKISKPTGVNEKTGYIPDDFFLGQNYPNPFNPTTAISYQLSVDSNVKLQIYDTLGRSLKTLVESYQSEGEYSVTWDATDYSNNPISSGVYYYKVETSETSIQKKMILIR